jgi:membrane protein implicated in regulation of membrane protease activity
MEPLIWLALLAAFLIIEAITTGLTTIWFAGGALVAVIASYLGAGLVLQLLLFLVVSVALLIFTRPLAVRYMNKDLEKTNVNSFLGKTAIVTQEIDNLAQTGQVRINDIEWMARASQDDQKIPEDAVVRVVEVHGVRLIVEEIKEG